MDKIQLLQERKAKIAELGKEIRDRITAVIDEDSFVELSAFSFSKSEFYGEDAVGEGVVTGFATIGGYPFYVVAQNYNVLDGGMSKASCDKIVKCLDAAEKQRMVCHDRIKATVDGFFHHVIGDIQRHKHTGCLARSIGKAGKSIVIPRGRKRGGNRCV